MKLALAPLLLILTTTPFPLGAGTLRGSPEKAELQNRWADQAGIKPIRSDKELDALKKSGQLVPLTTNRDVIVDNRLEPKLRFCRPEVITFLGVHGNSFHSAFADLFRVTSAVRTVPYQEALRRHNSNAAPTSGSQASSHLRGTTIDITKVGLTNKQVRWLRKDLGAVAAKGQIIVVEEFRQSVFHING